MLPRIVSLALILVLAGCGRSSTGVSDELLTSDVGGIYQICSLTFNPSGTIIPLVDIRESVMETGDAAVTPAQLVIGQLTREFELEYTRKGDVLRDRAEGLYAIRGHTLELDLEGTPAATVRGRLALPTRLALDFQAAPRRLTISEELHSDHAVSRADYERLRGESDPNLPDTIRGSLRGEFSTAGCS